MTDNEIIKAWEEEINLAEYVDEDCCKDDYCNDISLVLIKSTLDLINRLKAERGCYKNELHYANVEKEALNKRCGELKAEIERLQENIKERKKMLTTLWHKLE